MKINGNYLNLRDSYLFYNISQKVKAFCAENPSVKVYRLGIGDVTLPLTKAVTAATIKAAGEMGEAGTFRGYDDSQGYEFLIEAIRGYYAEKGVSLEPCEIFVSDGAKSDLGNILEIFGTGLNVVIPDPVYPVYVDTNVMAGNKVMFAQGREENGFLPSPADIEGTGKPDLIYICSPNNPTGAAYDAAGLKKWVDFANESGAVILYDAAYEIFARDSGRPTSIYTVEGAKTCAIEFCSLSKTAGFTGTRCGYTVAPLSIPDKNGGSLNKLWLRRRTTKFNGVPYIIQRAAEAVFTKEGFKQVISNIEYYEENAKIISGALKSLGAWFTGGDVSPYIWLKCPMASSWEFFDHMLKNANVVGTPGAGFGAGGEGFFRLTAFGDRDNINEAMKRFADNWIRG